MLIIIYEFVKNMLSTEYTNICQQTCINYDEVCVVKKKNKKMRKKNIYVKL